MRPLSPEYGQGGGDTVQDPAQVHIDHLVPVIKLAKRKGSVDGDPRDACEHVEAPEPAGGQAHQRSQVLRPGDVGALVCHLAAGVRDGSGGVGQFLLAAGSEHHSRPAGGQQPGGRRADATPGARDRHDPASDLPAFGTGHGPLALHASHRPNAIGSAQTCLNVR
jgi:hypothetical protein